MRSTRAERSVTTASARAAASRGVTPAGASPTAGQSLQPAAARAGREPNEQRDEPGRDRNG